LNWNVESSLVPCWNPRDATGPGSPIPGFQKEATYEGILLDAQNTIMFTDKLRFRRGDKSMRAF
jgi:hypothetical protein